MQSSVEEPKRWSKRQRLSTACNQCRKRKVRCDDQQPRCQNCILRGDVCLTTDPVVPNKEVTRLRSNKRSADQSSKALRATTESSMTRSTISISSEPTPIDPPPIARVYDGTESVTMVSGSSDASVSNVSLDGQGDRMSPLRADPQDYSYDREIILNTDHTSYKRKLLGGGTLQALAKHLDRSFERRGWEVISPRFAYGMQHSEEVIMSALGAFHPLPQLPASPQLEGYLTIFQERIHPIFPVLNLQFFASAAHKLSSQNLKTLLQMDVPVLSCLYSILAIVADENDSYSESGSVYLNAAYGISAYVTSVPYLSSVQAMLLLSIALRARNKDGAAWQTLGQAIRIAQSIGLHRHVESGIVSTLNSGNYVPDQDLDTRVWWACYCLEKTMGLEVGRPTFIRDIDCNQQMPQLKTSIDNYNVFYAWIGLARIQSRLIDVLYHRPPGRRNALDLLGDIGHIDHELCVWATDVEPQEIRPDSDVLWDLSKLRLSTFLSMHYYQTLITVHQAALMIDSIVYQAKIEQYCNDSPWRARLHSSETILLNSARKIASLQMDLTDRNFSSRLLTVTPIMLSIMVLAFNIMQHPQGRRNRSDFEMLKNISHHAEAEYKNAGQNQNFVQAISLLQNQIKRQVFGEPGSQSIASSQSSNTLLHSSLGRNSRTIPSEANGSVQTSPMQTSLEFSAQLDSIPNVLEDFQLEDPWAYLFSDDNNTPQAEFPLWNGTDG